MLSSEQFLHDSLGSDMFDAICMQLIFIGETLKQIDKLTDSKLLSNYSQIDWRAVKGMRDIISHNYSEVDEDAVFNVCKEKIPELRPVILEILNDLN